MLERLRGLTFSVGLVPSDIETHKNGAQYFEITVLPLQKIVATTSEGKIFIRIADKCEPAGSQDLHRIVAEKDAYQWEIIPKNISVKNADKNQIKEFIADIKKFVRVKSGIKQKSDIEILEHYNLDTVSVHKVSA